MAVRLRLALQARFLRHQKRKLDNSLYEKAGGNAGFFCVSAGLSLIGRSQGCEFGSLFISMRYVDMEIFLVSA